jgi:hypothetical protein
MHHKAVHVLFKDEATVVLCKTHDTDAVLRGENVLEEVAAEFKKVWHTEVVGRHQQLTQFLLVDVQAPCIKALQYQTHGP